MRTILIYVAMAVSSSCAAHQTTHRADRQAAEEDVAKALDEAANELEKSMSPEERMEFRTSVEQSAISEMQTVAKRCGTSLVFSSEARFEDRKVWAASTATAEQIDCVQVAYPFVTAAPK